MLAKGSGLPPEQSPSVVATLFEQAMPHVWQSVESARTSTPGSPTIPMPVWEDLWRCFAVSWLGVTLSRSHAAGGSRRRATLSISDVSAL